MAGSWAGIEDWLLRYGPSGAGLLAGTASGCAPHPTIDPAP
jgi:hypothetical protein